MTGIVTQAEPSPETGVLYLDESGGFIEIGISAGNYTKLSKFHIAPFNDVGGGYTSVATGQETNVIETASNLVALIAAFYTASATVSAVAAYQVKSDHTGVLPTALDLSAASHAGTDTGGSALGPEVYLGFTAHTASFARWQVHLQGVNASNADFGGAGGGRDLLAAAPGSKSGPFGNYLLGLAAGPGLSGVGASLNTQVVAHSGEPLIQPMYVLTSLSRRIRRRFRAL